jgi:N-acetylmuramoyl-L-alanine amidase
MTKKNWIIGGIIGVFGIAAAFTVPNAPEKKLLLPPPGIRTLIIDPGHGGKDPGAHGLHSHEADIALDIALKFGKDVQEAFPDIKVIYTRTTDVLPGGGNDIKQALRYRADLANKSKGDLFISIHCNATEEPAGGWYAKRIIGHKKKTAWQGKGKKRKKVIILAPIYESYWVENTRVGTETYVWAADRSDSKADKISENEDGGEHVEDSANVLDLNSPEARIKAQLYTKYYFQNSAYMAYLVEEAFKTEGRNSYGVKQRNYKGIWVLQATGMPSILVETGFVTNKEEENYLNSEIGQDAIAGNIFSAFQQYKNALEGSKSGSK